MRTRVAVVFCTAALVGAGCMVESASIEGVEEFEQPSVEIPTIAVPDFEPTPAGGDEAPTAVEPTAVEPTPTAEPTPEPGPEPLAVQEPTIGVAAVTVEPGLIAIPVHGVSSFRLAESRPILQLPGHSLIYVDADEQAEVDIFTPIATGDGTPIETVDDVLAELESNPAFAGLVERDPTTINGMATRVFEGRPITGERGFWVDESTIDVDAAGWFPPVRLRLWLIDAPRGPVIVSGESLSDPGQYTPAVVLAAEILSTLDLG